MSYSTFQLRPAADGQIPYVHCWQGHNGTKDSTAARGVMILAHGMGEHSLRYSRLADALVREDYVVYANDHRGHGKTVKDMSQLGEYGGEGWQGLIDDELMLISRLREEHDLPLLIMGHSMGSMVVQDILTRASDLVDGAALSGTTAVELMAASLASAGDPASEAGTDLFSRFNAAFEPVRTESDWLSRDAEQVDAYVADPLCGFSVSDDSAATLIQAGLVYSTAEATRRIRSDLPIYLFGGDEDPVGGAGELVKVVAARYRSAGIEDVRLKLYPGARHEVFNETNRVEVFADFIEWANGVRASVVRTKSKQEEEESN